MRLRIKSLRLTRSGTGDWDPSAAMKGAAFGMTRSFGMTQPCLGLNLLAARRQSSDRTTQYTPVG